MSEFTAHIHKLAGDQKELLAHFFVDQDVELYIETVLNNYETNLNKNSQEIVKNLLNDAKYESERDFYMGKNSLYLRETYGEEYIKKAKVDFMLESRRNLVDTDEIITQSKFWASKAFNTWLVTRALILIN